jgi:ketosteroid isomerase-like protein
MDKQRLTKLTQDFLAAWNAQDVEQVLQCYTQEVLYRDPNTRGVIQGAPNLRRYLQKLLSAWDMHWSLREAHPFGGIDGGAFLWHAVLKKAGDTKAIEVDGMDLVLLEGDRIKRNEVYFDRAVLASLL